MCGPYQSGKQTITSHKESQLQSTSRVLELVHIDLIGLMHVESIGGKRYVYVVVDDFSKGMLLKCLKNYG